MAKKLTISSLDKCPVPNVTNGQFVTDGVKQEDFLFGEVGQNQWSIYWHDLNVNHNLLIN